MSHSEGGKELENPWKNNPPGKNSTSKKSNSSTESKFQDAQKKLQAAVERFSKDYESSSSEDELESENVIGSILKNYSEVGGATENLGRTQAFLEDALVSGAATCLICIGSIKRTEKIWSCKMCYCFFHLQCIERWSKDSVVQQKESLREQPNNEGSKKIMWGCPKCRFEYNPDDIPRDYKCFCEKTINPPFHPWLVPHSCGLICSKNLKPLCGHECVLLCHPGPCPPCPKTVSVPCYCGAKPAKIVRCSNKEWSCGGPCKKKLSCGKHICIKPCHAGDCPPCSKRSMQKCQCEAEEQLRDCASPNWQCDKLCGLPLPCGNHKCIKKCHKGPCSDCELNKQRSCPCGKTSYQIPCTEDTPTCGDTCGKLLECEQHTCNQRCHKDKCGTCHEFAVKFCRCGLHQKEVQCKKPYLCDTKCKQMRDCDRHPCNRKCCDGNCPSCEKPCSRTLPCGLHKCTSVCHRGPCYPCNLTTSVRCRCGSTVVTVPCGRRKRTRPPKCPRLCKIAPDCHHKTREPHRCHFGECPPCKMTCAKVLSCSHTCPAECHSAVLTKIEAEKPSMPWEQVAQMERKCLDCPPCQVLVDVPCLGGHEIYKWPCYEARLSSCHRPCGRLLTCGNHKCQLECHAVENAPDDFAAGSNCELCENLCTFRRPEGCTHNCPKPCHNGNCPPCNYIFRLKCHCGLNQPYIRCSEWTAENADKESMQSCGNQCPKNYECGHRCKSKCHSGECPNAELCKKKVKVYCSCKRIKKEFPCETVRNKAVIIECDDACKKKQLEEKKIQEAQLEMKKKEEEMQNAKELEEFQKKFHGKKKHKDRKRNHEVKEKSWMHKYWMIIVAFFVILLAIYFVL